MKASKTVRTYICESCGATANGVGILCVACNDRELARIILDTPEELAPRDRETKLAYQWARDVVNAAQ